MWRRCFTASALVLRSARARAGGQKPAHIPAAAALRPLALFGLALGAFGTIADPDLWGHLRFGLDILTTGDLTPLDQYSFTSDKPWVNHEWLFEVMLGAVYQPFGSYGLLALKALLGTLPTLLTWHALRRTAYAWRWFGVALVAWSTLAVTFTLRPHLSTAIALFVVARIITSGSARAIWFLPPLFALWANLHGGWIVGGGIFAVWTVFAWAQGAPLRRHFLFAGVLSFACTLVNPHGVDLWRFLAETVRLDRSDISEWQPIWKAGAAFVVAWALTLVAVAISWRRCGRPPLAVLITLAGFAFAAARVNRLVPLFTVVAVAFLSRGWPRARTAEDEGGMRAHAVIDVLCVALCVAGALGVGAIPRCIALNDAAPDTVAAEALRGTRGRLVTHFDWGEYALWHFGPALKVSIDGRRETVYRQETIHEQQAVAAGSPEGLRALERMNPDYVWLPARAAAARQWLTTHGYRIDVDTTESFVAVRQDLSRLNAWQGTSSGCFPGP